MATLNNLRNLYREQANKSSNALEKGALEKKVTEIKKLIIAYEPIWAIGTGQNASSLEIAQMANFIKNFIGKNFPNIEEFFLLYGGSVNSKNSQEILQIDNVDGLLVGGASLDAQEFASIANS